MSIELKFDAQHSTQEHPVRQVGEFNGFIRQGDLSFLEDLLQRAGLIAPELLRNFFSNYIADAIARNTQPGAGTDGFGNSIIVGRGHAPELHLQRGHPTEDQARMYLGGTHQNPQERAKGLAERAEALAQVLAFPSIEWQDLSREGSVSRQTTLAPHWLQSQGFRALPKGGIDVTASTGPAFYQEVMRRFDKEGTVSGMTWIADKEALKVVQHLRG